MRVSVGSAPRRKAMSDDIYDAFGDDLYMEPEEEEELQEEEEQGTDGQNRTFIIAVAVLGGLLVCAIVAFVVWAAVLNPRAQTQVVPGGDMETPVEDVTEVAMATEEDGTPVSEGTEVAEETPEPMETVEPTDTPEPTSSPTPTPTPVIGPTNTPEPTSEAEATEEGGEGELAQAPPGTPTPTRPPRRTETPTPQPTATRTPRPTATPRSKTGTSAASTPNTGLGEVLLILTGLVLVGVLFLARRLRKA